MSDANINATTPAKEVGRIPQVTRQQREIINGIDQALDTLQHKLMPISFEDEVPSASDEDKRGGLSELAAVIDEHNTQLVGIMHRIMRISSNVQL